MFENIICKTFFRRNIGHFKTSFFLNWVKKKEHQVNCHILKRKASTTSASEWVNKDIYDLQTQSLSTDINNEPISSTQSSLWRQQRQSGELHVHTTLNVVVDQHLAKQNRSLLGREINNLKSFQSELWKSKDTLITQKPPRQLTELEVMAYLSASLPPQYAALHNVFGEIALRIPEFLRRSGLRLFDYGFGPALGAIACSQYMKEPLHALVHEGNPFMHNIADDLAHQYQSQTDIFAQFHITKLLPFSTEGTFDIFVLSNRLNEMKTDGEFYSFLRRIWSLVSDQDGLLILVEDGSPRSFQTLSRARSFLLKKSPNTDESNTSSKVHVVSPCPHDMECPMQKAPSHFKSCAFTQHFYRPVWMREYSKYKYANRSTAYSNFSYCVLRKGKPRPPVHDYLSTDGLELASDDLPQSFHQWPRIVQPVMKRRGHVAMDVCTSKGCLARYVYTKSQGTETYRMARKSKLGDAFPISPKTIIRYYHSHTPSSHNLFHSISPCCSPRASYQRPGNDSFRRRTTTNYMIALSIFALGVTYSSVPLYRLFCSKTGYGGTVNTDNTRMSAERMVPRNEARRIRIKFNGDVGGSLDWRLWPQQRELWVLPGETALAFYSAENKSDHDIIGVATYNIVPEQAALYFNKVACFCFEEQRLDAHEKVDLPVFFFIDPEFDDDPNMKNVDEILLSYTFFQARFDKQGNLQTVS
ncbi:cytochrome c oxidase assembly protein COX11 [Schizosaccharomyces japonicus yFS275]|uniref:Cytochrome c oxidase assembly protein COX11 n=1 Tax=Schizosaccharomyces japonicus (strain yFS275 / FY16936) TaxID=402676 RepID=B6K3X6_SCHJY|nr:cytochrome c oxidase assembly protein COX11 [Schizosaccharomyces japonicus yFS275]EEB08183.1 cytochrome c oxidase assembly protein COX11 [Schizosaccharomyces japonicus yFS275]